MSFASYYQSNMVLMWFETWQQSGAHKSTLPPGLTESLVDCRFVALKRRWLPGFATREGEVFMSNPDTLVFASSLLLDFTVRIFFCTAEFLLIQLGSKELPRLPRAFPPQSFRWLLIFQTLFANVTLFATKRIFLETVEV